MTLNEAKRIMFADDATFANLAEDRRWTVADGRVHFPTAEKSAIEIPADKVCLFSLNGLSVPVYPLTTPLCLHISLVLSFSDAKLMERTLNYARELEKIV